MVNHQKFTPYLTWNTTLAEWMIKFYEPVCFGIHIYVLCIIHLVKWYFEYSIVKFGNKSQISAKIKLKLNFISICAEDYCDQSQTAHTPPLKLTNILCMGI